MKTTDRQPELNGVFGWVVGHRVVANLIFGFFLIAGLLSLLSIRLEVFPDVEPDVVTVSVPYPGATPSEVEDGILLRLEDAVADVEGVDQVRGTAAQGRGTLTVDLYAWVDNQQALDDIKAAVDRIDDFPQRAEEPVVSDPPDKRIVLMLALYGEMDRAALYERAKDVKDDLLASGAISNITITGVPPYEISIDVDEAALRQYDLTFQEVAAAVDRASAQLPAGDLETPGRDLLVQTIGQAYYAEEYGELVVRATDEGGLLRLRDVADVYESFKDTDYRIEFDGKPAVLLNVFRIGNEGALRVKSTVQTYLEKNEDNLQGIQAAIVNDKSEALRGRIRLLLENGAIGVVLVILILGLFLELRLAFWAAAGMTMSFIGALTFMPLLDVAIHQISLFGFILVLGLVVDDAIVVGENIYQHRERGQSWARAAVLGAREVWTPVALVISSTIIVFVPMLFVRGAIGKVLTSLPIVVIAVLALSLVEALFILPAHLGHEPRRGRTGRLQRTAATVREAADAGLKRFINGPFRSIVRTACALRYITAAGAASLLLFTIAYIGAGLIEWNFFPDVAANRVVAYLEMPPGTPADATAEKAEQIARAARGLRDELNEDKDEGPIRHVQVAIGNRPYLQQSRNLSTGAVLRGGRFAEIVVELRQAEQRDIGAKEVENRWRARVGEVPGAQLLTFDASLFSAGNPIAIRLTHEDMEPLQAAAEELKEALKAFEGVTEISDSLVENQPQVEITRLTPLGQALGFSRQEIAAQVRGALFGVEAERVQRGRDEVRVYVRMPERQQASIDDLADLYVRKAAAPSPSTGQAGGTPSAAGAAAAQGVVEAPLAQVAEYRVVDSIAAITRAERTRAISVTADVDKRVANAQQINTLLERETLSELVERHPGLAWEYEGRQEEQRKSLRSLAVGFAAALIAIYVVLAGQLNSYVQPIVIFFAMPLGFIGAVWGHVLVSAIPGLPALELSFMSVIGIIALAGVIVNDALILLDLINRRRREPETPVMEAVVQASMQRCRPILLTTVTTFLALSPMIFETSLQAQFLIPTAVSLGFGELFGTVATLIVAPSIYLIIEDVKNLLGY